MKKVLALVLAAMLLLGCVGGIASAEEGKIKLVVWSFTNELQGMIEKYYLPNHPELEIEFQIYPTDGNAYTTKVDNLLGANATSDEAPDIFTLEAAFVKHYVESDWTGDLKSIGFTDEELSVAFPVMAQIGANAAGVQKGLSWQSTPGVLMYRASLAEKYLGVTSPEEMQAKVADWDTFVATAAELKEAGYHVISSVNDTYRVYADNVTTPWVTDGKITVDANLEKWVEDSMALVQADEAGTHELWSDDWSKGFYPDGKVFCYFGPAWMIDFSMSADTEGSIANAGGWGAVEGPQGFSWGGTWICGAAGTDNPTLVADIMRQMTTNPEVMKEIVVDDNDFVNNKAVMEEMAADESYGDAVLGGQNALAMFCAGADKIDKSFISPYDQGCTEEFQRAMKNYFDGNATYEEALNLFYTAVTEKYPELTY